MKNTTTEMRDPIKEAHKDIQEKYIHMQKFNTIENKFIGLNYAINDLLTIANENLDSKDELLKEISDTEKVINKGGNIG